MTVNIKTNVTIELRTIQDVDDLLDDIKKAKRMAKNGGEYYVYRTDAAGNKAVFKLWLPVRECV